jgi:hypothetical protein
MVTAMKSESGPPAAREAPIPTKRAAPTALVLTSALDWKIYTRARTAGEGEELNLPRRKLAVNDSPLGSLLRSNQPSGR